MEFKFAIAPCSWGIEDPANPDNPLWNTVLDEAGQSGFTAVELGPFGYLPTEPVRLKNELQEKNLKLIAGTVYDDLTAEGDIIYLKKKTRDICSLLSGVTGKDGEGQLVIIDSVKSERNNTAGHSSAAKRLSARNWKGMMENIRIISEIAWNEYGVRAVIHPHAGGYIEFDDETEMLLNDIPSDTAGLCLDTGHLYYAGDNPGESLKKYSSRLDYVHFKDINSAVYQNALHQCMGFFDACKEGVMCSIGSGCVDYPSVFAVLREIGYRHWVTVEQERDPKDAAGTLEDLKKSYSYLMDSSAL